MAILLEQLPIKDTRNVLLLLKAVKEYTIHPATKAYRLYTNNYTREEWTNYKRYLKVYEGEIIFPAYLKIEKFDILSLNNFIKVYIK